MVLNVHNYNMAGALVSSGEDDPTMDEDPTAGMPPGTRVHQYEDVIAPKPPTAEEIEAITGRPLMKPAKPKKAAAPAARKAAPEGFVSDRRRCLELAVASGETDPDALLAVAHKFLAFLGEE